MEQLPLPRKSLALFNITSEGYQQLQHLDLVLDQIFYLECLSNNINLSEFDKSKLSAIKSSLARKGYVSLSGSITEKGIGLLGCLIKGQPFEQLLAGKVGSHKSEFDRWWIAYPATDAFTHKGKEFAGTRALKMKKDECRIRFYRILEDREYTAEDLIRALEYEVLMKKNNSIAEGTNKLKYQQNALTYLNQRTWENFIELSKTKMKETGNQSHTIDI